MTRILRSALILCALLSATYALFWPLGATTDDGYFYLTIARNIAMGRGVTIDGTTLTNGFQPLWCWVSIPIYWVFPQNLAGGVRAALTLEWAFYCASAYVFGTVVQLLCEPDERRTWSSLAFWLGAGLYLLSPKLMYVHFNLLETGLLALVYLVTIRYYLRASATDSISPWKLGGLFGLLISTRIDSAFFVVFICLLHAARSRLAGRAIPVRDVAVTVGCTAAISGPWFLFGYKYFGSIMPISGTAQQAPKLLDRNRLAMATDTISRDLQPFTDSFTDIRFGGAIRLLIAIAVIAVAVAFAYKHRAWLVESLRGTSTEKVAPVAFGALVAAMTLLAAYYSYSSFAVWFYARYLAPIAILGVTFWAVALYRVSRARPALVLVGLVIALANLGLRLYTYRANWSSDGPMAFQVDLVQRHVPPDAVVGADQTGTLGYFRDRVINLDGKVNAEALYYRKNRIPFTYLEKRGIEWFCDEDYAVKIHLSDQPEAHGWRFVERKGTFSLYHHESPRETARGSER